MEKRLAALLPFLLALVMAALTVPATATAITIEPGDRAPMFTTETLDGGDFVHDRERMLAQVKKYASKMHYGVILDPELNIFSSYGVEIIPFAVLIDRDGRVVMAIQSLDPEPIKAISEAIDRLTAE